MRSPERQYEILFTSDAKSDVGSLDGSIRKRLKGVLADKLAVNPEGNGTPLRGALAGFWKHEFASHRVIYRIYLHEASVVVCAGGKRTGEHVTDVYKQLEPMVKAGKVAQQIIAVMKTAKPRR